jgi:hypothetical protein
MADAAEPEVIFFDLTRFGCMPAARLVIQRLMRRGGRIMWRALDPAAVEPWSWTAARVRGAAGKGRRFHRDESVSRWSYR